MFAPSAVPAEVTWVSSTPPPVVSQGEYAGEGDLYLCAGECLYGADLGAVHFYSMFYLG